MFPLEKRPKVGAHKGSKVNLYEGSLRREEERTEIQPGHPLPTHSYLLAKNS